MAMRGGEKMQKRVGLAVCVLVADSEIARSLP